MDNIEFKDELNNYVNVEYVRREPIDLYDALKCYKLDDDSDIYYSTFRELMNNFFKNHHDDTKLDRDALHNIKMVTYDLITEKYSEASRFENMCEIYMSIMDNLKDHQDLD